jgi:sirohydrochlorin ferrochelatase
MITPLVCVAHGSRDPRSAAVIAALVDLVRTLSPGLDARLAFLDLSAPRLPDVLTAVTADGHRDAVVVPLLLGNAYHARVDVPAAVHEALSRLPLLSVRIAEVLGPDPRLPSAALRRLAATGAPLSDATLGVVLAAAGSAHQPANDAVAAVAASWAARAPWAGVLPAFAAAAQPTVPDAIDSLRRRGARRIAVASWFLAPGVLPDRVAAAARDTDPRALVAEPLGASPAMARLVLDRYRAALDAPAHSADPQLVGI